MSRVQALVVQLDRARREAQADQTVRPPEVRSALLEVNPLLARLITEGGGFVADLHEAAHHRASSAEIDRVREWESRAEPVLLEILAALELGPEET